MNEETRLKLINDAMRVLDDTVQETLRVVNQLGGLPDSAPTIAAAHWVICADIRTFTKDGKYNGSAISWLPRIEQPAYISGMLAGRVAQHIGEREQMSEYYDE